MMYDEDETKEPQETEANESRETTAQESKPADEHPAAPAPEIAGLATEDGAEDITHHVEDDDPESLAGDEVDVELPETE